MTQPFLLHSEGHVVCIDQTWGDSHLATAGSHGHWPLLMSHSWGVKECLLLTFHSCVGNNGKFTLNFFNVLYTYSKYKYTP